MCGFLCGSVMVQATQLFQLLFNMLCGVFKSLCGCVVFPTSDPDMRGRTDQFYNISHCF